MEPARLRAWGNATDRMLDALRALLHLNWKIVTSTQIASRLLTLVVIGIGGWHVLNGILSFGGLVAMQLLVGRATGALLAGGSDIFRALQEANVALEQIDDFLRQPREYLPVPTVCTPASSASIRIESLRCTYGSNRAPALQDVTLELPPRGVIALIGRNGSGKSTVIRILSGMQRNFDGDVWVGDHSLRDFGPRAWRKHPKCASSDLCSTGSSAYSEARSEKKLAMRLQSAFGTICTQACREETQVSGQYQVGRTAQDLAITHLQHAGKSADGTAALVRRTNPLAQLGLRLGASGELVVRDSIP